MNTLNAIFTNSYLKVLVIPALAILFRLRGGGLGPWFQSKFAPVWGSTWARIIFWGICQGIVIGWLTNNWIAGVAIAVLSYLCSTLGWWEALGIDTYRGGMPQFGGEFWTIMARGLVWAIPGALVMGYFGYPFWPFAIGLLCPFAYLASWQLSPNLVPGVAVRNTIPIAELLFGGLLGLAFYVSYLLG